MPKLSNPLYCPECVKNQYQDNEDACFDFRLHTNVTEPGLLEVTCARCGAGAVYSTHFIESSQSSTQKANEAMNE